MPSRRPLAFVLASSNHGTMIVNRFDRHMTDVSTNRGYGVGFSILESAAFDPDEVELAVKLLAMRRQHHGDGVVALDCGANIGVHTIEWASSMTGWGGVVAFEAQERVYYALAGNIAISNCFNASALHAAVSSESGTMRIPNPNYLTNASFGSLELRQRESTEYIGQVIDYSANGTVEVRKVKLDEFNLPRVDFIKIDVEGMEMEVLEGARETIARSNPIMLVESIKSDKAQLIRWMEERGYKVLEAGINFLAIHMSDDTLGQVSARPAMA